MITVLFVALALPAMVMQGQVAPAPHAPWRLKDGTPIDEDWVIAFFSQHEQSVENYYGTLSDYWQPFVGADLRGVDLLEMVRKANPQRNVDRREAGLRLLDFSHCLLTEAKFAHLTLTSVIFEGADLSDASFVGSRLNQCVLSNAILGDARFTRAHLYDVNAKGTHFNGVDFRDATLREVKLQRAGFSGAAILEGARFEGGDATGAGFNEVLLAGASFDDTVLANSAFILVDLTGVTWQPREAPNVSLMLRVTGLETLRYANSGDKLIKLRKAFQDAGLRYSERAVNCALQTERMNHLWNQGAEEGLPEVGGSSTLSDKVEVVFRKVLFDWPVRYGLYPGRALKLIAFLCLLCALPYAAALFQRPRVLQDRTHRRTNVLADTLQSGIWAVPLEKRIATTPTAPLLMHVDPRREGWFRALARAASLGLFFSVISAFSTGYRDLDVGRWIERIKPEESTLRGTGWVRMLSGAQSLVSFYLLVLWLLTYFGRPFE